MASHEREVPPPPLPGPHGRAVNPEEEIPALNRGHRRNRSVKSAHSWTPFDIRAREPGEIDSQDLRNLQLYLVSKMAMQVEQMKDSWTVPLLPNAIKLMLENEGYLPSEANVRRRRSGTHLPVPMGKFAMTKSTVLAFQKYLNENRNNNVDAEPVELLEEDGLFGCSTVEAMRIFVETWARDSEGVSTPP
mmetsp:Transcript_16279/g.30456  ORF Transcript_16279/g.30456 Transcript_16279/m.30456 type:complete len:190 (-) Transcript_16279:60-629(-)